MRLSALFLLLALPTAAAHAAATCVAGRAGGYECEAVDLVSHLGNDALGAGNLNDVWGWTDPVTGTEYALVGAVGGTVFVDLSVLSAPRVVGMLPAHEDLARRAAAASCKQDATTALPAPHRLHDGGSDSGADCAGGSTWRNIKTYRDHAYIGSESSGHGLQVFDLRRLRAFPPGSAVQRFSEDGHYAGFGNSHTLIIDEQKGYLYAVGSDTYGGGPHFVDLRDPLRPVGVGGWSADGYTHEALCLTYAGPDVRYTGREICLLSNEDTLTVLDVTDKAAPVQLARQPYSESAYTHQGWLTADQRHLFVNDELDEMDFDTRTRTLVWDLVDLRAPRLADVYHHPTSVIDHNNYVRDGFVFQSNYTAGLVILDGRDPLNLFEVGYFDTKPADDLRRFDGTWSNYPFFASGLVAVSDITGGLFVLRPRLPALGNVDLGVAWSTVRRGLLRLTARNDGASAIQDIHVVVASDNGVAVTSVSGGAAAACEPSPDANITGQRNWHCRIPLLAAGGRLDLEVRVGTPDAAANIDAMISGPVRDPVPSNNRAQFSVAPGTGGGGGGGGGAVGLGLLGLLAALRLARRQTAPLLLCGVLAAGCASQPLAPAPELQAARQVSSTVTTAGALREGEVEALAAAGYDLIVDLRTPEEGVEAERQAAEAAGLRWVNIPVGRTPTRESLDALSALLEANRGARTVVHCASNRRASTMVMLHQVTREGRPLEAARADVEAVWTPSATWQQFIDEVLATPAGERR